MGLDNTKLRIFKTWIKYLANFKQVEVIIARAKSQFYQAGIKIIKYICDTNGRHPNIKKVLKISD